MSRKHIFYRGGALDHELRSLYEEKGKLPDMTRLEHEYHRRTTRILIGCVLFFALLTAASWAGFFLFGLQGRGEVKVTLTFDAPIASVSGVPQTIRLHYKNQDRDPLGAASIILRPPQGLAITATDPISTDTKPLRWDLGTLAGGTDGVITITAIPYGPVDSTIPLQAMLTYKPANFNAEFQTVAEDTLEIRASGISAALTGLPEKITPGQDVTLTLTYENKTDETFTDIAAVPEFPPGFAMIENPASFPIVKLAPGERGTLTYKGSFTSATTGSQTLKIHMIKNGTGEPLLLADAVAITELQTGALSADLSYSINNNKELRTARFSDQIVFTLTITNNSADPLKNVSADVAISSPLVNAGSAGADASGMIHLPKDGTISIEPNGHAQETITVPVVASAPSATPAVIEGAATVHAGDAQITTNKLSISVTSDLNVAASARYFGADQKPVGTGPLPPKVGQRTSFEMRWRLSNSFHDLSSIAVITILPQGVSWTDKKRAESGTIAFNPVTREVRWQIPRMPVSTPELNAAFEVSITPTAEQRGNLLLLLGVTRVEAQDTIVQAPFSTDAPSVSSSLDSDPFARGKGVVQ